VGAQIKNFNAQAHIAQPKFLIGKTHVQIAQVKNKIGKTQTQIAQVKNNIGKAQIAQRLKKLIKRKLSNILKLIITKVYCFENQCRHYDGSGCGASNR